MKKFILFLLFCSLLHGDILGKLQKEHFDLKNKEVEKSSDILENSWINPLTLSLQKNRNKIDSKIGKEDIVGASLNFNQDIFRSGGIFYAIKYAEASRILGLNQVDEQKNSQTILAYTLLLNILENDILQKQQKLFIQNSILDIKRKQEQYLAGLIDISFLNSSILEKISYENNLLNLKDQKDMLIKSFKKLSDKDYKTITPPKVKTPSKNRYINDNLSLKIAKHDITNKKYLSKLTQSQYLPRLTLNSSYVLNDTKTKTSDFEDNFYNIGLSLSMPIDIKTFDDIEKSKVNILISQNEYKILLNNQSEEYDKIIKDLKRIDEKINLAKENIKIYQTLLSQTKELVKAEIKISDDLTIMKNSKLIRSLEIDKLELQKQIKKLEFYNNILFFI